MEKQILFTKVNTAELIPLEVRQCGDDEVVVKTEFSTISCGTEKANIMGDINISIFSTGKEAVFPRQSGYSSSGVVIEKGKNVNSVEIGDKVAMSWSAHKSINIINEKNVVKIPDGVSMQEAALCHICTFPLAAVRKTRLEIGESMLVMGLGILGLLAVALAKQAGAVPVIAVDPVEERRNKALKMGADYALDPYAEDFAENVKMLTDGGANTAIEVTGLGVGLNQCLDCMAKFGRVALLGCTRSSDFSVDYYHKVHGPGISLIGAHTMARPDKDSSSGWFTQQDDVKTTLKLCKNGRIDLEKIIDEVYLPEECTEVYNRLVNDKNFPTVVQFDWRDEK